MLSVISIETVNVQMCNQYEKIRLTDFLNCESLFKFDNTFEGSYNFQSY